MKTMKTLTVHTAIASAVLLASFNVYALPTGPDDFEDGTTQGWTVGNPSVHPAPPVNVSTGGPAGAGDNYLQVTALGPGGGAGKALSVLNFSQWSGNFLAAGFISIAMDVNNFGPDELVLRLLFVNFPNSPAPPTDVAGTLFGVVVPANSGWTSVVFDLSLANFFVDFGTAAGALSDVNEFRLFHNPAPTFGGPGTGAPAVNAVLGIDNIRAVPEPGSLALLALGGLGLVAWRRRRSQVAAQK
jgi:hypothetical protein